MKHKGKIAYLLILPLLLSACGNKTYPIEQYFLNIDYEDNFRILQLTDIHLGITTNLKEQEQYLTTLIDTSSPHMIVITGDTFMNASKNEVDFIYTYFDSLNIPWSIVWGNHDRQGFYPPNYVIDELANYKNAIFINLKNDDVYGDSNYVVNLKDGNETIWRLYMLDSNSYYDEGSIKYNYDIIRPNQIEWYEKALSYEEGYNIPSLMFIHIPLPELSYAIEELKTDPDAYDYIGELKEDSWPGYKNSNMFEIIKKHHSTKGVFFGHDHINTFAVSYEDVILSYGVKSTNKIYHDPSMLGGQIITLPRDGSFSLDNLERIYLSYEK